MTSDIRPRRTETVLLCDDEESVRRLMGDVLHVAGYHVLEARAGGQALEVARASPDPVDILITDVVMPGLDGPELARRLRAANPSLAVLFISGWAQSEATRERVASEGEFLPKPFLPGELVRRVADVLERRVARPPEKVPQDRR